MEFSLETVKGSILNGLKILVPLSFPRLPKSASARGHQPSLRTEEKIIKRWMLAGFFLLMLQPRGRWGRSPWWDQRLVQMVLLT